MYVGNPLFPTVLADRHRCRKWVYLLCFDISIVRLGPLYGRFLWRRGVFVATRNQNSGDYWLLFIGLSADILIGYGSRAGALRA